jgi:hypothetical protein
MAATNVWRGVHQEDWQDTAWQDGGATQNCNTLIPCPDAVNLNEIEILFVVTEVTGVPVMTATASRVAGVAGSGNLWVVRVAVVNSAAAGNRAKWQFTVKRRHSLVQ